MLNLPAHAQARILTEQKHPKEGASAFRTPFYQQSLAGIRAFYREGNDFSTVDAALLKATGIEKEARREHNLRVLTSFKKSQLAQRALAFGKSEKIVSQISNIELKLSPDLQLKDGNNSKIIFLNLRAMPLDAELAKVTLEIARWILEKDNIYYPANSIEYVDLYNDKTYEIKKIRNSTIKAMNENFKIIETLWPTL